MLGLAGNLETAKLMGLIAGHDTAGAWIPWPACTGTARMWLGAGGVILLARDLLLRKTAPQGGAALLTGGYDEATMRTLGNSSPPPGSSRC